MQTTVSVVIPSYNAASYLRETIESALNQTLPPLEVIVVDDGSTDKSAAIAESFGMPVRVIRQENQGESVARNRGMDEARGDWIALLDSDDVWKPEKLERQLRFAKENVSCIHTGWYGFGTRSVECKETDISGERSYTLEALLSLQIPANTSTMLVPRQLAVRYPTWTRYAEDTVFLVELSLRGKVIYVADMLVGRRYRTSSLTAVPDMFPRKHQSCERWLRENEERIGHTRAELIREVMLEQLLKVAWGAFWTRQWKQFDALRSYLAMYAGHPRVDELLRRPRLFSWVYWLKDRLDDIRSGGRARSDASRKGVLTDDQPRTT